MNSQIAQIALTLLNRVDLKGSEVDAFLAVRNALVEAATPTGEPVFDTSENSETT